LTDDELMERVREGELERLEPLFERHHAALYRFFRRLVRDDSAAEDLVQEVFVRLLKYRHGYRSEGTFRAWLYQLARNAAFDQLEKRAVDRKRQVDLHRGDDERDAAGDPLDRLPAAGLPADERIERDQAAALLRRALDQLPAEKRDLLVMSRFRELRYEEIAEVFGTSVGAIKVRAHRAMKELRQRYLVLAQEVAS
jgi:RNA polymerase sigma factor (sigma-70 family)